MGKEECAGPDGAGGVRATGGAGRCAEDGSPGGNHRQTAGHVIGAGAGRVGNNILVLQYIAISAVQYIFQYIGILQCLLHPTPTTAIYIARAAVIAVYLYCSLKIMFDRQKVLQ